MHSFFYLSISQILDQFPNLKELTYSTRYRAPPSRSVIPNSNTDLLSELTTIPQLNNEGPQLEILNMFMEVPVFDRPYRFVSNPRGYFESSGAERLTLPQEGERLVLLHTIIDVLPLLPKLKQLNIYNSTVSHEMLGGSQILNEKKEGLD